jgi:hypothetical protein
MSLASRFLSLLAPEHTSTYPESSASNIAGRHDGFAQPGPDFGIERENKRLRTMETLTEDEDIEMKRPPYIQVRPVPLHDTEAQD